MYQIRNFSRWTEEDTYENGCLSETSALCEVGISFRASTPAVLIKQVQDHFGAKDDAIELDACDEDGRIDIQLMEDADGTEASGQQIAEWKKGKLRLWCATYTGYVEKTEIVKLKP